MSTKTTFKRVALVAVAALGMSVLSTTAANAATVYTTAITVTTDKAPVAGVNGTAVTHTLRFSTATTAAVTVEPNVILTSKPAGSVLAYQTEGAATAPASVKYEIDDNASPTADGTDANGVDLTTIVPGTGVAAGFATSQGVVYLHARYDVAGTYTYTIFDDQGTDDGVLNGTDFSTTFTVVVGATGVTSTYVATVSAQNSSSVVDGTNGSLVKIGLTSAGVAASPDNAGGVRVTLTGSAKVDRVNDGNVDNSTTYTLGNGDFNGSGFAWINVTNTAAETVTLTLSGTGSMASALTAPLQLHSHT